MRWEAMGPDGAVTAKQLPSDMKLFSCLIICPESRLFLIES